MTVLIAEGPSFIHPMLVLPWTPKQEQRAWTCAYAMRDMYEHKQAQHPRSRKSRYDSDPQRTHLGVLAETVLSEHLGVPRTAYYGPGACEHCTGRKRQDEPYDVWPDLELRAVREPSSTHIEWGSLDIYWAGDRHKYRSRRWVYAEVDERFRHVIKFVGWVSGRDITPYDPPLVEERGRERRPVKLLAKLYPDELRPIDELVTSVREQWASEIGTLDL